MKTKLLLAVLGGALLLGGCATEHNVALLDAKIGEATQGDFGQFLYHHAMAEENLAHARKIRQYWQDDYYWNIDLEKCALNAASRAAEHRKQAEEALIRWHDTCDRHKDICHRLDDLEALRNMPQTPVAYFDTGSAVPKSLRKAHIDEVLHLAKDYPNLSIDLIGYTDTVGSKRANLALSERRAHAVNDVLIREGLPATVNVHRIGMGAAPGPANTPNPENRRVDVKVHRHGEAHGTGRYRR